MPYVLKCDVCLETTLLAATLCLAGGFEVEVCALCLNAASAKLTHVRDFDTPRP